VNGYFDLGVWSRPVSTSSAAAQTWFDRGLNWNYGYNHAEAEACYRKAVAEDPNCAMAYWGIAYAGGPFYNYPWIRFTREEVEATLMRCRSAVRAALARTADANPVECALIEAMERKYQSCEWQPLEVLMAWHDEFVDAMRAVHHAYPDDLDVLAWFAESAITRTPRQLWDLDTGVAKPGTDTLEVQAALAPWLARMNTGLTAHPGLLHCHIHLMEMSREPESALRSADLLQDLAPEAGHLQHMPTHIYTLCGDYAQAVRLSQKAVAADDKFLAYSGSDGTFYTTSRCHDLHLYTYAAMFLGRYEGALYAANRMYEMARPELVERSWPYMASILDGYAAMRTHVFVRFGRWRELVELPDPERPDLFPVTFAMHAYGQGVARAALGEIEAAERARSAYARALDAMPHDRVLLSNDARAVLAVGAAMLEGEIAYREERFTAAFDALRRAVDLDDGLNYTEPWAWMHPPRHALGALLLEQGEVGEAEALYRADLGYRQDVARCVQHPDNIWSLHGLLECLETRGEDSEAGVVRQRLVLARARADTPVTSSCFCKGLPPASS